MYKHANHPRGVMAFAHSLSDPADLDGLRGGNTAPAAIVLLTGTPRIMRGDQRLSAVVWDRHGAEKMP
jgi:hypothetical protein